MATAYTSFDKVYYQQEGEIQKVFVHLSRFNPVVNDTLDVSSLIPGSQKILFVEGINRSATLVANDLCTTSTVVSTGVITAGGGVTSTDFWFKFDLVK